VVLRTLSSTCDAFIFIYIGLGMVAFGREQTTYNPGFIIAALFSILVSRTHVYIISYIHNWYAKLSHSDNRIIPKQQQIFLWFCGLRGAVSFSLGVQVLGYERVPMAIRALLFGTTIMVVFCTVVGFGSMTPYVMRRLGLGGGDAEHTNDGHKKGKEPASSDPKDEVSKSGQVGVKRRDSKSTLDEYLPKSNEDVAENAAEFADTYNNGFLLWVYELDQRYLRPFFSADTKRLTKTGDTYYQTTVTRVTTSSQGGNDLYEIGNKNVASAVDDDASIDDLDNVSIAMAAEMVGIAGTSTVQLPSARSTTQQQPSTPQSRTGSISNLIRGSRKNMFEMTSMSSAKSDKSQKLREDPSIELGDESARDLGAKVEEEEKELQQDLAAPYTPKKRSSLAKPFDTGPDFFLEDDDQMESVDLGSSDDKAPLRRK